jgi:hydroxypyruvate reductase
MLMVWGGETTVKLSNGSAGLGGRSQELALAAAEVLHLAGEAGRGIAILSAGTDGRDGPTDAAGAVIDASTWELARANGRDPLSDLERHDSYRALDAAGALLRPGMTGTNVNDVVVVLIS